MVVLDSGYLVASPFVWEQNLAAIVELDALAKRIYPKLHWAKCDSALIRQTLTEAEAARRERAISLSFEQGAKSMAKQALIDIVADAYRMQATDIHLRMAAREARIAYRIHGQIQVQASRSRASVTEAIAAALNTQSDDFHDVFDERHMSSASISLVLPETGQTMRIRTQKSPCRDGFSVTLRLQPSEQQQQPELSSLGFNSARLSQLGQIMQQATGLLLISGPTGHGKTTTLAGLNKLVPNTRKVISLEDPIEIIQPQIEQKFVPTDQDHEAFAKMIKAVLREDPDLVEVSEIRDRQTANAAISAALTGHLVVSTIHANDALGIVARLLDLGLSPSQLSQPGLFAGLLAQRLIPKLCPACKVENVSARWGLHFKQAKNGCENCQHTGLVGRVAVSELVTPEFADTALIRAEDWGKWRKHLLSQGWDSMAIDAMTLIKMGTVDPLHAIELVPDMRITNGTAQPSEAAL